jgi:uncharacterized membrane protein YfcA
MLPLLPPVLAFIAALVSSIAGGVGDAVTFHTLWALCGAVGLIPLARLRKAVLYASIIPFANAPLMFYRAKVDVVSYWRWGFLVAVAAAAMTPLGALLLLSVDVILVKRFAGVVFFCFGTAQLYYLLKSHSIVQTQGLEDNSSDTEKNSSIAKLSSAIKARSIQIQHSDGPSAPTESVICSCFAAWPQVAKHHSKIVAAVILLVGGLASGFLGGMLGTSGPPLIVAYSLLALEKDAVRGVTVSMQSLVIGVRIYVLVTSAGSVFDWIGEWHIYAGIVVCAWAGFTVGAAIRERCDSRTILLILSTLLVVSAAIMLGALEDIAMGCAVVGLAVVAFGVVSLQSNRRRPDFAGSQSVTISAV